MRTLISMAVLSLLLASCRGEHAESDQAPAPEVFRPAAPTAAAAPAAAAQGSVTVRRADGSELLTVREQTDGVVEVSFVDDGEQRILRGEPRETGKRKYSIGDSAVMFEIKPGDNGFKLRMADGTLRWKVKIDPRKIKISDNEQNANPFELKIREGDSVKVTGPGDRELGRVRFDRAASKSDVDDASSKKVFVVVGKQSAAYGVLLLEAIPPPQRYILFAEILSRGR